MASQIVRPQGCICVEFRDTGGFRIADLTCPVHGVGATDPGDGPWDIEPEVSAQIREALAAVERGEVVDLGDFAQYAEDEPADTANLPNRPTED